MSVYKVPQDVEADDKLIGPFSFRQFIYLIIVALAIGVAWGLAQLFVPLAIIPIPVILLFGVLALPLRKDQPMEIYLAAIISYFLKPHLRLWDPDGIESLVEITAPHNIDVQLTKNLTQNEAETKFGQLAEIVDSQGWAVRGLGLEAANSAMNTDIYFEAQQVQDVLDNDTYTAQVFDSKLDKSDNQRRQAAINILKTPQIQPIVSTPTVDNSTEQSVKNINFNPYPEDMQQKVVNPISDLQKPVIGPVIVPTKTPVSTSEKGVPAGIIDLASNTNLSVAAIARAANQINDEVIIKLR